MIHRNSRRCLAPVLILAIVGCAPGLVKVNGTVLRGGKPIPLGRGQDIGVVFYPLNDTSQFPRSYLAEISQNTGYYTVPGPKRTGIPPGKYKVTIRVATNRGKDVLDGAFSVDSPIIRDIKGKEVTINIDLDKPKQE